MPRVKPADDGKLTPAKPPSVSNGLSNSQSSKQRAKARKQGGLHAMLARQKQQQSTTADGFGLDLMDLMKKD
ncbi:MAG: hypothetical protein M1817_005535 [Caeruleum heppii]|nr:MAG: hypothetical protein M1817_005535 [Caeruleum heppii]